MDGITVSIVTAANAKFAVWVRPILLQANTGVLRCARNDAIFSIIVNVIDHLNPLNCVDVLDHFIKFTKPA
jgi:hypothetical protein